MLRKLVSYFMVIVLVITAITFSEGKQKEVYAAADPTDEGWILKWSDEFDGTSLDTTNWSYDIGTGDWGWGNGEAQYYTDRESNVSVSDGTLKITAKKENYDASKYTSGRINSKNKRFFKYGKMEALIKVENGNQNGVWPAFWMQGNVNMSWPARGEMDIMEHRNCEDASFGTIHWGTSNSTHQYWGGESTAHHGTPYQYADGDAGIEAWHTYGVTWDENTIKWYVDNQVYQTVRLTSSNRDYFRRNYYFVLNLALGSQDTPFTLYTTVPEDYKTATMYVDYVRAYSYEGAEEETMTDPDLSQYTQCTVDSEWHDVGAWQYYLGTWSSAKASYKGGSSLNDFSIHINKKASGDWGTQIKPDIELSPHTTYSYDITVNTDAEGSQFKMNKDVYGNGTKLIDKLLTYGTNRFTGTFTTASSYSEILKLDLANLSAETTFSITSFSLTECETPPVEETTVRETATAADLSGYTNGTADSAWHNMGAWQYYLSSGAGAKAMLKGGETLDDFSVYITKKASYDWGTKISPNITLTANTTYYYSMVINTDAEDKILKMNKDLDGSGTKILEKTLVNGTNTFTGSFRTGGTNNEKLILDLAKLAAESIFTITSFVVTDTEPTTAEPTTQEPTTAEPTTVEPTTEEEITTLTEEITTVDENDPYARLDWVTVANSNGKYQAASFEDFGIQTAYMNGSGEILVVPYVNTGTFKIWAPFSNEVYNGVSGNYSEGAGIHIPTNLTEDNAYNIYSAASNISGQTFYILIKEGTPATPENVIVEETTEAEVTTEEETTSEWTAVPGYDRLGSPSIGGGAQGKYVSRGVWKLWDMDSHDSTEYDGAISYKGSGETYQDLTLRIDEPCIFTPDTYSGNVLGMATAFELENNEVYEYTVKYTSTSAGAAGICWGIYNDGTSTGNPITTYQVAAGENVLTGYLRISHNERYASAGTLNLSFYPSDGTTALPAGTQIQFTEISFKSYDELDNEICGQCGENAYWSLNKQTNTLEITGSGSMDSYSMPSDVPWYPLRDHIESVSIASGITDIGSRAFDSCSSLIQANISASVRTIGNKAFYQCSSLTQVIIPDGVTAINDNAFCDCDSLTKIIIPESVTTIGNVAFYSCNSLTDIYICNENCSIYDKTRTINSDTVIHGYADSTAQAYATKFNRTFVPFNIVSGYCGSTANGADGTNLQWSLNINAGVLTITGSGVMANYTKSDGTNVAPWYEYKDSITLLRLPNGLTKIGNYAFYECENIAGNLTIPNSVTAIGGYAFYHCSSLSGSLTIPDSVKSIGSGVFSGCSGFTGTLTISNNITAISGALFNECSGLTGTLIIPSGVKTIGNSAFNHCSGLTGTLVIPDSVTSIGTRVFQYCSGFTGSLIIPEGITTISNYAFVNCKGLTEVEIPESVTGIGSYAFYGCKGLTEMTIPEGVTSIGTQAFYGSSSIKDIYIYSEECEIYDDAKTIPAAATIHGYTESTAETYATTYNRTFVAFDDSTTEEPTTVEPTTEEQTTIQPTTVEPTTEEPTTVQPTTVQPTTVQPTTVEPTTKEPVTEEMTTKEPVTEKPTTEPATEDSAQEEDFKIASKTLALSSGISLVFKVNKSLFENRYEEPKIVVLLDGFETEITEYKDEGSRYAFEFTKITPDKMNVMVEATLHASKNGKEYVSPVMEYSVATYVYNMLNKYGETPGMETLRTLLVDLLNYGAASQNYTNFNTDNPANAELTATQRSWGRTELGELTSVKDNKYMTIDNPGVLWKSAGLALQDAVIVKMKFQTDSTDGLVMRVTDDYGTIWDIEPDDFEPAAGTVNQYYVNFRGFNVGRMSECMYFTAYRDGKAVSNTYRYSVESYVYARQNDTDALGALVVAMMKYGKSAQAFNS